MSGLVHPEKQKPFHSQLTGACIEYSETTRSGPDRPPPRSQDKSEGDV